MIDPGAMWRLRMGLSVAFRLGGGFKVFGTFDHDKSIDRNGNGKTFDVGAGSTITVKNINREDTTTIGGGLGWEF